MIIGHTDKIELFENLRAAGELPHALLFTGPAGVGKRTFALALAHWLQKEGGTLGDTSSSVNDQHPDIYEAEVPLTIKEARAIKKQLSTSAYSGGYKVVVISDADTMHRDAANALLKTLEEPKGDTVFVLITEHANLLLDTIRSRCSVVRFRPVADKEIAERLSPPEDLKAHWSGRPGVAARLVDDAAYAKQLRAWRNDFERFLKADTSQRFLIVEKYAKMRDNRVQLAEVVRVWAEYAAARKPGAEHNREVLTALAHLYQRLNASNANAQYLLHNMAVQL